MSNQARSRELCVGIVPSKHAALFGEELRAAFPQAQVTLRFSFTDDAVELWVSPGLTPKELHRWARQWRRLRDGLTAADSLKA